MLVGRTSERLALDHLLADARVGRSGVLALVGEPGIGKTALLDYAAETATGMRVLRARGIESEAEVPFAGLSELLRPALGVLDRIPAPQAAALTGALALGPGTANDRFAIGAATLSLLSACAEEMPLALLVDDVHLLDGSSAGALLFAARRLVADPIALALTVREGERSLVDGSDLRVLRVAGLDRADAAALVGDAAERLYAATGGNPLALLELAPEAGRLDSWPSEGPIPISTSIAASFARRAEELPEATRRVLVLAAAADRAGLAVLARAAASIGVDAADLAPAEAAGLVVLDADTVEFRHPLVRSALYASATAQERRDAHAALARALPDRDVDRRAWHLAAASVGPDAQASAALERAGERALERSAYAVAAAAFERGAILAPADDDRCRLLYEAADAAWLGGDLERTAALLADAESYVTDRTLEARIRRLQAHVAMQRGPLAAAASLFLAAAEATADADLELAVTTLAEAVLASLYVADTPAMLAAAARAGELAGGDHASERARFFALVAEGLARVAAGEGETGTAAVRGAVALLEGSAELLDDPRLRVWSVVGPLWLRESEGGRELIAVAFERARADVALGVLSTLLPLVARDQAATERWGAAAASYDEAIRLTREAGRWTDLAASLAGAACLDARRGREAACRAHAAEAAVLCNDLGIRFYGFWPSHALGDLELGLGRAAESVAYYEAKAATMRDWGIVDVDHSPAPELVEAYLRLGRTDDAVAAADEFVARAEEKGQPWALARAARCRGLVADPDAMEPCFDEAIELHERTPDAYETARTRLAYGARLRRARKRVRSREELRAALEIFERLGAEPWAEQTRAELEATGETARRRNASTLDDLTPQELQIARLLADGKTTREAAAAIFLSPKTVEYHLRNVYRKLGIRSREELADAFG
jgi:DNA-binding CsgD family transcriptional regulator